jgi:prepilin-type processing-associated H-X9-DG protein
MLDFKIDRSRVEGVHMDNIYFPSHFLGLICGWPGSGKTSLLKYILKEPQLLFEKYDEIILMSPSLPEWFSLCLPKENMSEKLDVAFLDGHVNKYNKRANKDAYINVLIVIDDLIADLTKQSRSGDFMKYIFNR